MGWLSDFIERSVKAALLPELQEMRGRLDRLEAGLTNIDQRTIRLEEEINRQFAEVDQRFEALQQRIDSLWLEMNRRFEAMHDRIDRLREDMHHRLDAFNQRLDGALSQITSLQSLEERVKRLEERVGM